MAYLNKKGLTHSNICGSNVVINNSFDVSLIDFGTTEAKEAYSTVGSFLSMAEDETSDMR